MLGFILLTFIAYLSIDFAVYWLGNEAKLTFNDVFIHHLKMLPIYLTANIMLSIGFNMVNIKGYSPILLFGISILIWIISLLFTSMILFKTYPSWTSLLGFGLIIVGVIIVQVSVKS